MREQQIVITLKPEQYLLIKKLARNAGVEAVDAFVRQQLLAVLGIEGQAPGNGAPEIEPLVSELKRLHVELRGFVAEALVAYQAAPPPGEAAEAISLEVQPGLPFSAAENPSGESLQFQVSEAILQSLDSTVASSGESEGFKSDMPAGAQAIDSSEIPRSESVERPGGAPAMAQSEVSPVESEERLSGTPQMDGRAVPPVESEVALTDAPAMAGLEVLQIKSEVPVSDADPADTESPDQESDARTVDDTETEIQAYKPPGAPVFNYFKSSARGSGVTPFFSWARQSDGFKIEESFSTQPESDSSTDMAADPEPVGAEEDFISAADFDQEYADESFNSDVDAESHYAGDTEATPGSAGLSGEEEHGLPEDSQDTGSDDQSDDGASSYEAAEKELVRRYHGALPHTDGEGEPVPFVLPPNTTWTIPAMSADEFLKTAGAGVSLEPDKEDGRDPLAELLGAELAGKSSASSIDDDDDDDDACDVPLSILARRQQMMAQLQANIEKSDDASSENSKDKKDDRKASEVPPAKPDKPDLSSQQSSQQNEENRKNPPPAADPNAKEKQGSSGFLANYRPLENRDKDTPFSGGPPPKRRQ